MMRITIWTKVTGEVTAELSEAKNPRTAEAIYNALPIKAQVATWGEEIYFPIKIKGKKENTQQVVDQGDIGYWPPGDALCIFFGPTPASMGDEIRPASPVNVVGRILDKTETFKKIKDGDEIMIDKVD